MRVDYRYVRDFLNVFLDSESSTVDFNDFDALRKAEGDEKFVFHFELMADRAFIVGALESGRLGIKRSPHGEFSISVVPLRLTADGHDFATALDSPKVLSTVTTKLAKFGISVVADIAKKLATSAATGLVE